MSDKKKIKKKKKNQTAPNFLNNFINLLTNENVSKLVQNNKKYHVKTI